MTREEAIEVLTRLREMKDTHARIAYEPQKVQLQREAWALEFAIAVLRRAESKEKAP